MKSLSLLLGLLSFLGLASASGSVAAEGGAEGIRAEEIRVEDLAVLALDPAGGRAVLQLPDGSLRTVAPGEDLREARVRVRKILIDRIVVEEMKLVEDMKGAGKSRRQIWIFRARPGERSRVQVLDRERPAPPPILKPQSMKPEEGSGNG